MTDLASLLFREAPEMKDESPSAYLGRYSLLISRYFVSRLAEGLYIIAKGNHRRQGQQMKFKS